MEYKLVFPRDQSIDQTNYYIVNDAFNAEELEWINNLHELYPFQEATVMGENDGIRKSEVKWMHSDDKSFWVYEKIGQYVQQANNALWKFNLQSIVDSIQYTVYYEGGGHYDWHVDIGPGSINHRKVSLTIQLSDPDEYEGGDLQIWTGGQYPMTAPKGKGNVVIFPSFMMHRVTPVIKGTRKSFVLWLGGGHYR
jgi:PKHD-type hydroxylase